MNRTKIKNYAPQARRDFLQAMTDRSAHLGLTVANIEPVKVQGDVAVIGGRAFSRAVAEKRKRLEAKVRNHGFERAMEAPGLYLVQPAGGLLHGTARIP